MRKEIRVIGIDDSPFDKFNDTSVLLIGTLFRGGSYMDGVMSTVVEKDGFDATQRIAEMVLGSRARKQVRCILLDGINVAGDERFALMKKAGRVRKAGDIYVQFAGCGFEFVKEVLSLTCTRSNIPEPVRVAHLIAAGVVLGESRGSA